jgi:hypothetical protein
LKIRKPETMDVHLVCHLWLECREARAV